MRCREADCTFAPRQILAHKLAVNARIKRHLPYGYSCFPRGYRAKKAATVVIGVPALITVRDDGLRFLLANHLSQPLDRDVQTKHELLVARAKANNANTFEMFQGFAGFVRSYARISR